MLYQLLEWQRPGLDAWRRMLRVLEPAAPWPGWARALAELAADAAGLAEPRPAPIETVVAGDGGGPVFHEVVETRPFHRLVRFRRAGRGAAPILLLTPCSGYAAAVTSRLVLALLELSEVLVIDWQDARLVPAAAGRLGLAEQTALVQQLVRRHKGELNLVAFSQAGIPALHALAGLPPAQAPLTLALLGAPVDATIAPTAAQRWLTLLPRPVLEHQLLTIVAGRHPGAGRRVYPGLLQALAYAAASPALWLDVESGHLAERMRGDGGETYARSHADLYRLADMPGELMLDMVAHFRGELALPALPAGLRTRLATVEAGGDELVGAGQTHAAQALWPGPAHDRIQLTLADARHHDLVSGPLLGTRLTPTLARLHAFPAAA